MVSQDNAQPYDISMSKKKGNNNLKDYYEYGFWNFEKNFIYFILLGISVVSCL